MASLDNGSVWIIMELCEAGSIKDLMRITQRTLNEKQIAYVCHQTLQGLAYLHSINLVHRDVKAANILLNADCQVKIGDFGLSEQLNVLVERKEISGSLYWLAPEILEKQEYSSKSDIWALGITVIEMCENVPPFKQLKKKKKFSAELEAFINTCLTNDPEKRPDSIQLFNNPFVAAQKGSQVIKELIDASKKKTKERWTTAFLK